MRYLIISCILLTLVSCTKSDRYYLYNAYSATYDEYYVYKSYAELSAGQLAVHKGDTITIINQYFK